MKDQISKAEDLKKDLYILGLSFIIAAGDKDPKRKELWKKYQEVKHEYTKAIEQND